MTIGIGFNCVDGIVLCADNQITFPGSHKFYERKLYSASGKDNEWKAGFTFAGTLDLMKNFYENFVEAMKDARPPLDISTIKNVIKGVLLSMDVIGNDERERLDMVAGIVVPSRQEFKLLKTAQKIVSEVDDYEYVGIGDCSILRYLGMLLCGEGGGYSTKRAILTGIYMVMRAKTYVSGCGGETEVMILKSDGNTSIRDLHLTYNVEQSLLILERHIHKTAALFFDPSASDKALAEEVDQLAKMVKDQHHRHDHAL